MGEEGEGEGEGEWGRRGGGEVQRGSGEERKCGRKAIEGEWRRKWSGGESGVGEERS